MKEINITMKTINLQETKEERAIQFLAQCVAQESNNIGYSQAKVRALRQTFGLLPNLACDVQLLSAQMGTSLAAAISNHKLIPEIDDEGRIIKWVTPKEEAISKPEKHNQSKEQSAKKKPAKKKDAPKKRLGSNTKPR